MRTIVISASVAGSLLLTLPPVVSITLAAAEGRPEASGAPSEEDLRRDLDHLEARYEAACRQVGAAVWERRNGGPKEADAQEDRAWDLLSAVYADPLLEGIINQWAYRSTVTRDPSLSRRVRLWKTTRQGAAAALDPRVRALTRRISRRLADGPYKLAGRAVSRGDLLQILEESPDREKRRLAWIQLAEAGAAMRADLHQAIRLRAVALRDTRAGSLSRLMIEAEDIEPTWLLQVINLLGMRSQPAYDRLAAGMKQALQVDRLEPWDLDYALAVRARARGESAAAPGPPDAARELSRLLQKIGFTPPAMASRPLPEPAIGLPVSIPGDYRLAADPRVRIEDSLAAAARALTAQHVRQGAPMLKGYPWLPTARSEVFSETMAMTLEFFRHDPHYLDAWLGLGAKQAGLLIEEVKDRELLRFRRDLVLAGFEYAAYINPDADLDARYRDIYRRGLGVDPAAAPPDWTASFDIVERPLSSVARVLAPAAAAEVHARLARELGEKRFDAGAAAGWLRERCYEGGETLPLGERLAKCTDRGYDFGIYFRWLGVSSK